MRVLFPELEAKLRDITELSQKINNNDNQKILTMMNGHVKEITERYNNQDDHWAIETADLIVLCYELLIAEGKDIDDVFEKCLPRFDVKLKRLIKNGG